MTSKVAALGFRSSVLSQEHLRKAFQPGDSVVLSGWVSFFRKQKGFSFLGLRDAFGSVQVVLEAHEVQNFRLEDVVTVEGVLRERQTKNGVKEFELEAKKVIVENRARHPLPLGPDNANKSEGSFTPQQRDLSLKYRYLDMRMRPALQRNLRIRSSVALAMRNFLTNEAGFLEVETPTLFKSTPEGAREFLVPVERSDKNARPKFYALVQSPQQFKQMLMVGGIDRYYQIARCYRDESGRADRQPEFTQLDLEMSFVRSTRDIEQVIEGVIEAGWKTAFKAFPEHIPQPPESFQFPHVSLDYALRNYGSDKPNMTFGMKIDESGERIRAPNLWGALSRKEKSELEASLKKDGLADSVRGTDSDIVITAKDNSLSRLGRARLLLAQTMKRKNVPLPPGEKQPYSPFWVVNFGMFEPAEDGSTSINAVHHPFTAPHPDDLPRLVERLHNIENAKTLVEKTQLRRELCTGLRSLHYDLVCDGIEIGGGSVRIHDADLQMKVFTQALGLSEKQCQEKFGHLLEALSLGAPPHGGFAIGFDRFLATLCGVSTITETIAFPKATMGTDPLSSAPTSIPETDERDVLARFGLESIRQPVENQ